MKKLLAAMQNHRKVVYALVALVCVINGLALAYAAFRQGMDLGDSSTFYSFARNVSNGEVPFKDFIHFRTPGTIGIHALFLKMFGVQQSSSTLATYVETLCLFPLLVAISAMILFRKRHPMYVVLAAAGAMFTAGAAQLRAGFGLLAIACYIASFDSPKHEKRYLIAAGILGGATFTFGQEIALMVGLCMLAGELIGQKREVWWPRLKWLLVGGFAGLLPLLGYILVKSDFGTFLYYTTYYSFVLQPKHMDLPFPAPGYSSILFYLPFLIYAICFLVLYMHRAFGKKEALLLSFGILRLITALGRADTGHLMFSITEVFVIVPVLLMSIPGGSFSKKLARSFAPFGLGLVALLILSMIFSGIFLVAVPFLLVYAVYKRPKAGAQKASMPARYNTYLALGATFGLLLFLIFPVYYSLLKYSKNGIVTRHAPGPRIGGVKFEPEVYNQIKAVEAAVAPLKPNTIFAFPIQPFYYTLARHHATRYMTYEPQTTVDEQEKSIKDLERTKPEVIVFDPLQAHGLSGSLWKISDYITEHYEIKQEIQQREILWIMVPKQQPARDDKLAFQLYKDNKNKKSAIGVQNRQMGLENAIWQHDGSLQFFVDTNTASALKLTVSSQPGVSECGTISISYSNAEPIRRDVCVKDGEVSLPIKANQKGVKIVLDDKAPTSIIWNNPRVVTE